MLAPKGLICLLLLIQIFKYLDSLHVEDSKDVKSGYSITFVSIFCHPFFLGVTWLMLLLFLEWILLFFMSSYLIFIHFFFSNAIYLLFCSHDLSVDELLLIIFLSFLFFSCHSNFQNFKENPHFEDTKLIKTFTFSDEGTTKITGTDIKWKEGMVMLIYNLCGILYSFLSCLCLCRKLIVNSIMWRALQMEAIMRKKETNDLWLSWGYSLTILCFIKPFVVIKKQRYS
jgi:hypothetical protein